MPKVEDLDDDGWLRAIDSRRALTRKLESLGYTPWDMHDDGCERWMGLAGNIKVVSFDEQTGVYIDKDQHNT
jgi:hypothetical protein